MQRLKDWFSGPPSEEDIDKVEKDYEAALHRLASLVHNCDDVRDALRSCAGDVSDPERLQTKVREVTLTLITSAQTNFLKHKIVK
jgi:hypothetical protein